MQLTPKHRQIRRCIFMVNKGQGGRERSYVRVVSVGLSVRLCFCCGRFETDVNAITLVSSKVLSTRMSAIVVRIASNATAG